MKKPDIQNCPGCGVKMIRCVSDCYLKPLIKSNCSVVELPNGDLRLFWESLHCDCRWLGEEIVNDPPPDKSTPPPSFDKVDSLKYLHCIDGRFVYQKMKLHPLSNIIPTAEEIELRDAKEACEQYANGMRRYNNWMERYMKAGWFAATHPATCPPIPSLSIKQRIIGERMGWIEKE